MDGNFLLVGLLPGKGVTCIESCLRELEQVALSLKRRKKKKMNSDIGILNIRSRQLLYQE